MLVRRVWPSRPSFDGPFGDFDKLRLDMLRLLGTALGSDAAGSAGAGVFPPLNVSQDDENFYVSAEVPGIKPNELSISAVRNRLAIAGQREIPRENERVSYHRKERAEGSFSRSVTLPNEVDADRVEAQYLD